VRSIELDAMGHPTGNNMKELGFESYDKREKFFLILIVKLISFLFFSLVHWKEMK
jgi:hypothetical protein